MKDYEPLETENAALRRACADWAIKFRKFEELEKFMTQWLEWYSKWKCGNMGS